MTDWQQRPYRLELVASSPVSPIRAFRRRMGSCQGSTRFPMHLGRVAKPTRFSEIEKLPVARRTVDHMRPLCVFLDVLVSRRSAREVSQNVRSGATLPFWIGVRGLHRRLVLALQPIPLLFR